MQQLTSKTTKEQILQTACKLIQRKGFNNTSLEDILRESGVGKGNFYYYFKSKDDLGYAVLDRLALWTSQQIGQEIFGKGEDPIGELFELFDLVVAMQREARCMGGCPLGNLAIEMSDIHDGFRRRIEEILASWRSYITGALTRAQAKGQLAQNVQLDRIADFIFAEVEGAILVTKVRKDLAILEGCLDELKQYVRGYLV
jgi:TetR/AcrR family transcriptional repressor of nem operon